MSPRLVVDLLGECEVDEAVDAEEHVVDVVRNAAREATECVQLGPDGFRVSPDKCHECHFTGTVTFSRMNEV